MEKFKTLQEQPETPLELSQRFRAENSEYADQKMTYAGRLRSNGSHSLLVALVGEECKKRKMIIWGWIKEYIF